MSRATATAAVPATRPAASAGAIARASAPATTSRLQGEDVDDIIIPRVHIFQGLPQEREIFGKFDDGDLINTLTREKIASRAELKDMLFVPIFGFVEYIRFSEPRGSGIMYRERDKSRVPAADLEWDRAQNKPPKATKIINWVCLFGDDPNPVVLSFKSTSIKTGQTINTIEKQRGSRGPGLYALELKETKNAKGAWLKPLIRPAGDPTPEKRELADALYNSLANNAAVTTNLDDDAAATDEPGDADGSDFDPNARE